MLVVSACLQVRILIIEIVAALCPFFKAFPTVCHIDCYHLGNAEWPVSRSPAGIDTQFNIVPATRERRAAPTLGWKRGEVRVNFVILAATGAKARFLLNFV